MKIRTATVATIGIFDGVHRGHKKILKLLKARARAKRAKSCVLTFDPHPSKILHPEKTAPMLVSTKHKLNLLAREGVDITVLINFSKSFAEVDPIIFVKRVLVDIVNVRELLVGENFSFGNKRRGSVKTLKRLGRMFGFEVRVIPPLKSGGRIISSTLIRRLIMSGRLSEAKRLLGRDVSILGTVTRGTRRGRILGFPTANLDLHHEAIPPSGVYAVKAKLANKAYRGIVNIGFRPTFDKKEKKEPTVEVHIFNFHKSIYGKDIEVVFMGRIRSERKFKSREHLLARIAKDIAIAKTKR